MSGKIVAIALLMAITSSPVRAHCLSGESADATVTGVLKRMTFAGPPNYDSLAAGDRPETYFVLRLATPACLETPEDGAVSAETLQLLLDTTQFQRYRPYLGHTVKIVGRLWPAQSGHHHTPLMLTPRSIVDAR